MAKRHYSGKFVDGNEGQENGYIGLDGNGSYCNMPREMMMKPYAERQELNERVVSPSINYIDKQIGYDVKKLKSQLKKD